MELKGAEVHRKTSLKPILGRAVAAMGPLLALATSTIVGPLEMAELVKGPIKGAATENKKMRWTTGRIAKGLAEGLSASIVRMQQHIDLNDRVSRLQRILAERLPNVPEIAVVRDPSLFCSYDAVIERQPGLLRLVLSAHNPWIAQRFVDTRGGCFAYWLLSAPESVSRMMVTLADGNEATLARFAASTNIGEIVPLPDPYFFDTRGFARIRQVAAAENVAWADRSSDLVWRGATSGQGLFHPQRLRSCAVLLGVPGTDVKFASSVRPELQEGALARFGFMGRHINESTWIGRKYALDVDGHANTWSNLIARMHLGCCVLKVESELEYRQWYYDRLRPWEHYVPVKADCSDLVEKFDWVRAHDAYAQAIARCGQALARSLTFDSVRAEAAELIAANWDR